jgi:hypothetical protein
MLQSVEYHMAHVGPITVQKGMSTRSWQGSPADVIGYWFSSHEQWKVMEMPYYDVDIIRYVSIHPRLTMKLTIKAVSSRTPNESEPATRSSSRPPACSPPSTISPTQLPAT